MGQNLTKNKELTTEDLTKFVAENNLLQVKRLVKKNNYLINDPELKLSQMAIEQGNTRMLNYLLKYSKCQSQQHWQAVITPLLFKRFDDFNPNSQKLGIFKSLLNYGANPNLVCATKVPYTCDFWGLSIMWNDMEMVKLLATSGLVHHLSYFNTNNNDERIAASCKHSHSVAMLKLLLNCGVLLKDIVSYEKNGNLEYAISTDNFEMLNFLSHCGADFNLKIASKNAIEHAQSEEMINFLINHNAGNKDKNLKFLEIKNYEKLLREEKNNQVVKSDKLEELQYLTFEQVSQHTDQSDDKNQAEKITDFFNFAI